MGLVKGGKIWEMKVGIRVLGERWDEESRVKSRGMVTSEHAVSGARVTFNSSVVSSPHLKVSDSVDTFSNDPAQAVAPLMSYKSLEFLFDKL